MNNINNEEWNQRTTKISSQQSDIILSTFTKGNIDWYKWALQEPDFSQHLYHILSKVITNNENIEKMYRKLETSDC